MMFCERCGAQLQDDQNFCRSCGQSVGGALMPAKGRIAGHVRLLGILWLAISAWRLTAGIALMAIFRHAAWVSPDVPDFVSGLMRVMGGLFLAGAVLGLVAGWGLLQSEPWGRMLTIILGCFSLMDIPFGAMLGIYSLWVLLPAKSEQEYRTMARVA